MSHTTKADGIYTVEIDGIIYNWAASDDGRDWRLASVQAAGEASPVHNILPTLTEVSK